MPGLFNVQTFNFFNYSRFFKREKSYTFVILIDFK